MRRAGSKKYPLVLPNSKPKSSRLGAQRVEGGALVGQLRVGCGLRSRLLAALQVQEPCQRA